ncbi:PREDICTED: GBF-interacting protein 1-like isoform X1 [Lupinus angustifolius]|uniref:GBF-interacting protein 1-like isoform X1 n=1 Tax=Lupinus angustifolius TaxID=3871 RepID=UPI00092FCE0B|nr:PREDICTED: GBF-interacting protein 1-like isoform X1 [Lupinus angustifolius]
MVTGSRMEVVSGTQIFSAKVRKTIQSIKEIVGNHSDADIYVALKETNMDPNETTQKLLFQDPFHEVKRRRERKKEPQNQNVGNKSSAEWSEPRRHSESVGQGMKFHAPYERNFRRANYSRNTLPDPFHEVKRRRERKKEPQNQNVGNKSSAEWSEPRRHSESVGQGMKFHAPYERNFRRANYSRNTLPGNGREFRVVRDNRVNRIYKEVKPPSPQCSTSANEQSNANTSENGSAIAATNQSSSGVRNSSALNGPSDSHARSSKDAVSNASDRKFASEGKQSAVLNAATRVQSNKPNSSQQNSTTVASTSSAVGVYSSSTDPVHVPSPDSRASSVVGAIRREVGVVGVRRQSSDNKVKQSSAPSNSSTHSHNGKAGTLANSFQSVGALSKTEQISQTNVKEPSFSGMSVSRPSMNNQHNSRPHQPVGHQRASQHNKEWKPKSSKKPSSNSPGVVGKPKKAASPTAKNSRDIESNTAELQDKLSQVNIYENKNVIIAQHIRVPETERCRLTFGTIGIEIDTLRAQSEHQLTEASEKSNDESTASLTVPPPELSTDDVFRSKQVDLQEDHVRSTELVSPASDATAEQQLPDKKVSSTPHNPDNYANIGLVRDNVPSYAPSESHQQDSHDMPGFSAYDPPTGNEVPYFRPTVDESVRGQALPSPHEGLSSHAANSIPASAIPLIQQQQPPIAQMYPQVHVSHYANLMPYRQFLSPVYVPPMGMPGYSSNQSYPHPSNGSSYVLMPGGGSHLNANSLKYGVQQFKPVPAGNPAGFGNYANPTGYAIIPPGVVGAATALEDSSRVKYKDNLYVPNPQAETSEIWLQNQRDMQSTPYYNMQGQAAHAAYMPSHTGHASFNAAAVQSSHMQFPGMYHAPPQPATIPGPHHLGPPMGNNVGVGVAAAAPGAQVGAYQQPQMGHLNWTTNF